MLNFRTLLTLACAFNFADKAFAADYCAAKGSITSYEWIKEVKVNGVANTSAANGGYVNFGSPIFQLNVGQNPITLTPGFSSGAYTEFWSVFVDLNRDNIFSSNERLFGSSSSGAIIGSLTIPTTIQSGPTRMRVLMGYGSAPGACSTFTYGEVEDYPVNLQAGTATPTTVITATLAGFDKSYTSDLVVVAKHRRNGVLYNSTNLFSSSLGFSPRTVSLEVDIGTQIEWSAAVYLDYSPAGVYVPASCSSISGDKCITTAGSSGQSVIFKAPAQPNPIPADQVLTFENMFGGVTYKAGPTILIDGVTATTTAPYFYNNSGAPFTSGYFSFINLALAFPNPVKGLSFKASGSCTNCSQTVTATADGQVIGTFVLNYNVVSNIVLPLSVPASSVSFNQGFKMDDLTIDYQ